MVGSVGIEPTSMDLQSTAMTTFANAPYLLEESVGFEPTERLNPLVFKTSALSQTRPTFQNNGLCSRIRTYGLSGPNGMLYQAELYRDSRVQESNLLFRPHFSEGIEPPDSALPSQHQYPHINIGRFF